MAAAPHTISLGAATLGLPAAPGHTVPDDEVPAPWLVSFREQYTDAGVHSGLFRSCPAGRDWVLTHSPKATLRLDTTAEQPRSVWERRLSAAKTALQTRGRAGLPTRLVVEADSSTHSAAACALIPALAGAEDVRITELDATESSDCVGQGNRTLTSFLHFTTAVAPHLTRLVVHASICNFPPPSQVPSLKELDVHFVSGFQWEDFFLRSAWDSISALVPQLTSLELNADGFVNVSWEDIFTVENKSHTLTHFESRCTLDDLLLGLLLDCCPALTHLKIDNTEIESDDYKDRQWGVKVLTCRAYGPEAEQLLAHLPEPRSGRLELNVESLILTATSSEGLDQDIGVCERLPEYSITTENYLTLTPHPDMPHTDHPAALRSLLAQLSTVHAAHSELCLDGWVWTADMVRILAAALPGLQAKGLALPKWGGFQVDANDAMLGVLAECAPQLPGLRLGRLQLASNQHAAAAWPWQRLQLAAADCGSLCRLPLVGLTEGKGWLGCDEITLGHDMIQQVGAERLQSTLQCVSYAHVVTLECPSNPTAAHTFTATHAGAATPTPTAIPAPTTAATAAPAATSTQTYTELLSVLGSLRTAATQTPGITIQLDKWPLTSEVIVTLQGLPHWDGSLDISTCVWPTQKEDRAGATQQALAQYVPTSYTLWQLGESVTAAELASLCSALNERRGGLGLSERVRLLVPTHEGGDKAVGECVVITRGSDSEAGDD